MELLKKKMKLQRRIFLGKAEKKKYHTLLLHCQKFYLRTKKLRPEKFSKIFQDEILYI